MFIAAHQLCGDFHEDIGEPTAEGYRFATRYACGGTF